MDSLSYAFTYMMLVDTKIDMDAKVVGNVKSIISLVLSYCY
jgi:hypothetical protein